MEDLGIVWLAGPGRVAVVPELSHALARSQSHDRKWLGVYGGEVPVGRGAAVCAIGLEAVRRVVPGSGLCVICWRLAASVAWGVARARSERETVGVPKVDAGGVQVVRKPGGT